MKKSSKLDALKSQAAQELAAIQEARKKKLEEETEIASEVKVAEVSFTDSE